MKEFARKLEELLAIGGTRKDICLLAIAGVGLALSLMGLSLPIDPAWAAILLCGVPIVLEAIIGLVTAFDIKADVLVSLALIASVSIGETFAAGEIAFIMQLGGLLEELTVARAQAGIEKLVRLTPQTARVIDGSSERIIPAEEARVGDILRVLPGENVPVDGLITVGQSAIDQAVLTGESLPVDKTVGDEVFSGTVNQFGAFEMRATKVGEDSSIQRMIRLMQSADPGKAKIVGLADRWATWVVVIALTASALTWLITGEILRAVTILVVFCPCSMVLATPTAIMAAIGNATEHGFLVREGDALERLAEVKTLTFDKTGTLTYGKPEVIGVVPLEETEKNLFALAAAGERQSEHPLGKAIVQGFRQRYGEAPPTAENFAMEPGRGITAQVAGKQVLAGNRALLAEKGIAAPENEQEAAFLAKGATVTWVAVDGRAAGYLALADTPRPESGGMICKLYAQGLRPVLLTGDSENVARTVAEGLGIQDYQAECLPEEKLERIRSFQAQGQRVCMIGDGVNDAPALKAADVGIAMGGVGSDIAVDAADIALVDDRVEELPHLMALSRRMMGTIRRNLTFSMALNAVAILLAITGILNPVVGALVHNAGSVLVIVNSAFLLKWRETK